MRLERPEPVRVLLVAEVLGEQVEGDGPHLHAGLSDGRDGDGRLSAQESAATGETVTVASAVAPVPLLPEGFHAFAATR